MEHGDLPPRRSWLRRPLFWIALIAAAAALWFYTKEDPWVSVAGSRTAGVAYQAQTLYAVRTVNVRAAADIASAQVAVLERGAQLRGQVVTGNDQREWLELSDGSGFVSIRNLSPISPPAFDEVFDETLAFNSDAPIYAQPEANAEVIARTSADPLRTVGKTGDWYEVLLDTGVGYIRTDQLYDYGYGTDDSGNVVDLGAAAASAAGAGYAPSPGDTTCSYASDGTSVACGANATTCAYSSNGRYVACGGLATTCAYSSAGNHVACGGRATTCAYSSDGASVACGGQATTCAYSSNGNDVACGGLATTCAYSSSGNDVACGGRGTTCAYSSNGNDVACGGDASSCAYSSDGNDVACGGFASGCRTSNSGRRACGDGVYSAD